MKGIQVSKFGEAEVLKYMDLPDPIPEPGQVLIQVSGASVNFADIKARSGSYHLGKKPPFIPGIDVAGVVIETGRAVKDIKIGDRVIAFPASGSYAEKAVADQNLAFVIPDSLDLETAAACPIVVGTATHMLTHVARIKKTESVLIHAAGGGVGSTAVQAAKAMGASQIIASVGSPWKETYVRGIGADTVIDYKAKNYAKEVGLLTDGKGVDVILNPIGGETIAQDLQCLAPFGRLIVFGQMSDHASRITPERFYGANKSVIGFSFGHYRRFRPALIRKTMQKAIALLENKRIEIPVGKSFPLKKAAHAHKYIEARKALGKVVLVPDN